MKYVIGFLFGLLLGGAGGLAALYFNPLTAASETSRPDGPLVFDYSFPGHGSLALTHDGQLDLPAIPAEIPALWERPINRVILGMLVLEDPTSGSQAVASRISVPSPSTDLLLSGVLVADHWIVSVPGEGSFVIEAQSNFWPLVKDTFLPVSLLGRPWRGPAKYFPTAGPRRAGLADAYGVSGRFAGMRGTATESLDLDGFSRARGIESLRGELAIELEQPPPAADADWVDPTGAGDTDPGDPGAAGQ